jgi:hypothetical protein
LADFFAAFFADLAILIMRLSLRNFSLYSDLHSYPKERRRDSDVNREETMKRDI